MCAAAGRAPGPLAELVIALVREPATALAQPRAKRMPSTIQPVRSVFEVFSCLLPQSSLGPVADSISACRGSPHGRAYLERSMSSHNSTAYCQSTSPLHTPSRNPALLREPSDAPACPFLLIFTLKSLAQSGQRLRLRGASANSGDASSAHAGWPLHSSTSHEKTGICSRTFPGCSSFPRHVTRTTGPRERHAGACQARFPELRCRANFAGEKASFAGSPADR